MLFGSQRDLCVPYSLPLKVLGQLWTLPPQGFYQLLAPPGLTPQHLHQHPALLAQQLQPLLLVA